MERSINDISVFADGLDHPECVALHPDGTVWAGGEAGQIYRITPDGKEITEVANLGGFILGIAFSTDASWLAICDLKKKCVWKYNVETGALSKFADGAGDVKFITPNFPVFDNHGNLYVSDSGNFRQNNGKIFRFDPSGQGSVWHAGPFSFSNGMALSADHNTLLVVCSWLPGVERIRINPDGTAGERSVLVQLPQTVPDGIAVDVEDNVYLSCYAPNTIYKISKEGRIGTLVHDWESHTICNPTNIAFGGHDRKDLFIANLGRWHIARLRADTAGAPLITK